MRRIFLILILLPIVGSVKATSPVSPSVDEALEKADSVRVVVTFEAGNSAGMRVAGKKAVQQADLEAVRERIVSETVRDAPVVHRFDTLAALVVRADRSTVERLARDERVHSVSLDPGGRAGGLGYRAPTEIVNVDLVRDEFGLTGMGTRVAVVDSGIERNHPDFSGRVVGEACYCADDNDASSAGCCPSGGPTQFGPFSARDAAGHGTRVSGLIAGAGEVAPTGAAPQAELIGVRVLDEDNRFCCASDIAKAFEWLAMNYPDLDVVNASLETDARFAGNCDGNRAWLQMLAASVEGLNANGTLVVSIAGNSGSLDTLAVPGCLSDVVATGATTPFDLGPVSYGDVCTDMQTAADKPACFSNGGAEVDLLAPGVRSVSSDVEGSLISGINGTSYSAPLVAGCAALIRQSSAGAGLGPAALKSILTTSPVAVTDPRTGRVRPRLDCRAAMAAVSGGPSPGQPVNFGMSGSWYAPETGGQGFAVEVSAAQDPPLLVMYWYTYSAIAGGPEASRWYVVQGAYEPGQVSVPMTVYQTTGGRFDRPDPATVTEVVGNAEIEFNDCSTASFSYSITPVGAESTRAGEIDLVRLTPDVACQSLR
jgi:subtilisin family serine protease